MLAQHNHVQVSKNYFNDKQIVQCIYDLSLSYSPCSFRVACESRDCALGRYAESRTCAYDGLQSRMFSDRAVDRVTPFAAVSYAYAGQHEYSGIEEFCLARQ